MGYLHIDNLYKNQEVLLFRECFALEKIHGTSAHVAWKVPACSDAPPHLSFFSGGEKHDRFVALFDQAALTEKFLQMGCQHDILVYGEAYGGSQQGMSKTYGDKLKFIVFDVQIGDSWLTVPKAEAVAKSLGLEFVDYKQVPTTLEALDAERDASSVQAVRNGISEPRPREGIVIRPLVEVTKNNGARIIAKHKGEAFQETAKPRKVVDPAQLEVLTKAREIADEWVTPMRLQHILGKRQETGMEHTREIIDSMLEDVEREAAGEVVLSQEAKRAIAQATAKLFHDSLKTKMRETV